MPLPYKRELIPFAKQLRRNATKQEQHLWYDFLKEYPVKFRRQCAISGFIADFYCASAKLIIEVDGSQHYEEFNKEYDIERSAILSQYGIKVLRFSNSDVDKSFSRICDIIDKTVRQRTSSKGFPAGELSAKPTEGLR